jgi:hypothetical protein
MLSVTTILWRDRRYILRCCILRDPTLRRFYDVTTESVKNELGVARARETNVGMELG